VLAENEGRWLSDVVLMRVGDFRGASGGRADNSSMVYELLLLKDRAVLRRQQSYIQRSAI
jgi:hypothetical protein